MIGLLNAVNEIHKNGLIHRDIKPSNIAINLNTFKIQLVDFGLADFYFPNKEFKSNLGTNCFKSPEILLNHKKYFQSIDMWGVGCVLACLVFN